MVSRAPTNGIWPPPAPIEKSSGIPLPEFRNADQAKPALTQPVGPISTPSTPANPMTPSGGGMMGNQAYPEVMGRMTEGTAASAKTGRG